MPFFDGAKHQNVDDEEPHVRIGADRASYGGSGDEARRYARDYSVQGAASNVREPVQLQYGSANRSLGHASEAIDQGYADRSRAREARGQQNQALALQYGAATGQAPSRAETLGRGLIGQSLQAQMAGAASARGGPLAQMAAQRQASQGAAAFQAQGMNQLAAMKAGEMADARNAYMAGASGMRAQDYAGADQATRQGLAYGQIGSQQAQMAQAQAGMDFNQRQLNQQREMGYEGMAHDIRNQQANRNLDYDKLQANNWQFQTGVNQHATDRKTGVIGSILGGVASAGAGIFSDDNAKVPMSLGAGLQYGGKVGGNFAQGLNGAMGSPRSGPSAGPGEAGMHRGATPNSYSDIRSKQTPLLLDTTTTRKADPKWLDKFMASQGIQGHDDDPTIHEMPEVDGSQLIREDPYSPPTPGGIQREDPYGSGEVFFSDERAKKKAFSEGFTYGQGELYYGSKGQPNQEPLPDYMQKTRTPVPQGQDRALTVEGPETATKIDPKARGVRPEPTNNVGDRATEQGAPRPQMTGIPANKDVTGQKPGPLASIQQDANRRGAGFPYAYKDQYRPAEQAPGELNYGFSAQELEKNPLTATAVKKDPNGMRFIDANKLLKTNTAGIASLQNQIDQLRYGGRRG